MNMRLLVIAASVVALCSCGGSNDRRDRDRDRDRADSSSDRDRDRDRGNDEADRGSSSGSSTTTTDSNGGGDAMLQQQVALAAQMLQSQVPIHQGPVTITNVRAEGTELITSMTLPVDLNEDTAATFRTQLPAQQCSNPQVAQLINRGARYTYIMTDSGGEEFTFNISSCPGAM